MTLPVLPATLGFTQDAEVFPGLDVIFQQFINWADGLLIIAGVLALIVACIALIFQSRSRHAEGGGKMFGMIIFALIVGGMAVGIVGTISTIG